MLSPRIWLFNLLRMRIWKAGRPIRRVENYGDVEPTRRRSELAAQAITRTTLPCSGLGGRDFSRHGGQRGKYVMAVHIHSNEGLMQSEKSATGTSQVSAGVFKILFAVRSTESTSISKRPRLPPAIAVSGSPAARREIAGIEDLSSVARGQSGADQRSFAIRGRSSLTRRVWTWSSCRDTIAILRTTST